MQEYQRQFDWRDWAKALDACPIRPGQKVLDLGCGHGDLSAQLAARGARVTGVDSNQELISYARERGLHGCSFLKQDLRSLQLMPGTFDGLWCSFTAAYFTELEKVFRAWTSLLNQKSWVCVVEMDDLLGHEPLGNELSAGIQKFYEESLHTGRYDFQSGRKLRSILEGAGFQAQQMMLNDRELAFNGPATPDVLQAWAGRLDRMSGLKNFLGSGVSEFKTRFLETLAREDHHSTCRVFCVVGKRR